MATITATRNSGQSNGAYATSLEFFQAYVNDVLAPLYWTAGATLDVTGDALTVTSATGYGYFANEAGTDIKDARKADLKRIARPAAKRYLTAALTAPDTVVLTLSNTHTGGAATGDGFDGNGYTYGPPGASF